MVELVEYKKTLPKELLEELSENKILEARDSHDKLAEIIFNMWLVSIKRDNI